MKELDYIIWMDLILLQDSTKQISTRTSTQVLDFLGDVGGFQGSLIIILYLFGEFFSSKLLAASIAKSFYLQKSDNGGNRDDQDYEGGSSDTALKRTLTSGSKRFIEDK